MIESIKSATKSGHGNAILYATMIGLIASDIIPTPADAIYFKIERNLRDKWKAGTITPKQYWTYEGLAYYGLNPLWWSLVLGATIFTKGDYTQKMKVGVTILGAGAVIGVLYSNVRKDMLVQERNVKNA